MRFTFSDRTVNSLGDVEYNSRHARRNRSRVEAIARNCLTGDRALDIGCNQGYFSKALLSRGLARHVDAIEYDANIVSNDLKSDSRFSLFEGDATDFLFEHQYDVTIYGAVHHHIFAIHGYAVAMRFWNDVIDHTGKLLFMESGQLGEGSRWYWQRALRNYYSTDEQYYGELLCAIGSRLKSVSVVGRYWLHGVRRWLLKIELWPSSREKLAKLPPAPALQIDQTFRRTIGSIKQQLVSDTETLEQNVHEGVVFKTGTIADGTRIFCKQYVATAKETFEAVIAEQINDDRFVTPIGISADVGLVYPFIEGTTLANALPDAIRDKESFRRQLLALYEFAKEKKVVLDFAGEQSLKLVDIIDLHAANLIFDEKRQELQVVDLEFYSMRNASRNRLNVMKMLYRLGPRDLAALASLLSAIVARVAVLVSIAASPPEYRILNRVESFVAWAYVQLREYLDRFIAIFVPSFWK